jgi:CBS domain-containing membrane protein
VTHHALRTVADLMTGTVIVLQHDEAVGDSTDDLDRFRLRHLPVMDGDRVVGVVTHRELLRAMMRRQPGDPSPLVAEIMSRDVVTVTAETPVTEALALLITRKSGCLVVLDGAGLAGIVTEYDCVKLARSLLP